MLRRLIAGSSAGLLLAAGLVSSSSGAAYQPWGSTHAKDQVLKSSCAYYHYHYRIDPPTDDWAAEIFLSGPNGVPISSGALDVDSDPAVGKEHFRLCRASITPGRYKIRMKITYLRDHYDKVEGFVKPSYFRIVRR